MNCPNDNNDVTTLNIKSKNFNSDLFSIHSNLVIFNAIFVFTFFFFVLAVGTQSIQLQKSVHILIAPGIIQIIGEEGVHIELSDAIEMREANLKLSENKPFCILMNGACHYHTYSSEAKKLLASEEYCKLRKATAFVVNSLSVRMLVMFFLNINQPKTPTRIFSSENEAIEWLKTFDLS